MGILPPIALEQLAKHPTMSSWFRPTLLLQLLGKVIVSGMFGQYADRRLMIAALDDVDDEELFKRTQLNLIPDKDGAVWIDFVADLGDGFDPTYAIASLLARDEITLGEHKLPRGQALIMGGDEVYPLASRENYRQRLRDPYDWAFPDPNPDPNSNDGPKVFAVPGNHDWYDGLMIFLALFAKKESLHLGAWRSSQRRSYFALQVTEQWWIWCADTQLADDIDVPQDSYFRAIAKRMPEHSNIILCGPEPGWLYVRKTTEALSILDDVLSMATSAKLHHKAPLLLSGDTHHYSRYYNTKQNVHYITSGGGGAFLHPTHQLEDKVNLTWLSRPAELSLTTDPAGQHTENGTQACYPNKCTSKLLLLWNLLFPFLNWGFSSVFGVIYWVLAMTLVARNEWDATLLSGALLIGGMVAYFGYQEKWRRYRIYFSSLAHGLAHWVALVWLTRHFEKFNRDTLGLSTDQWHGVWQWFFALGVEMIPAGLLVGGFIFGLNLLITCMCWDMNHNDAFSSNRLECYKHFLRLKIKDDEVTVYPIGLRTPPKRSAWRINPNWAAQNSSEPAYIPEHPLNPELIEGPISVKT